MDIDKQYDKLLRYCTMKLRDRALAEDITQETFIRFFESATYRSRGKEMAYLYTIAANLCTDYYRKQRETLWDDMPPQAQGTFSAEDSAHAVLDRLSIEAALDRLNAEEREAVMLRYSCDLTVTEIGQTLHLSRFAVRRRISSAMKTLRKELSDDET